MRFTDLDEAKNSTNEEIRKDTKSVDPVDAKVDEDAKEAVREESKLQNLQEYFDEEKEGLGDGGRQTTHSQNNCFCLEIMDWCIHFTKEAC